MFRKSGAALSDAAFEAALFAEEDYVYRISFIYLKEEAAALENVQEVAYRAWRGRNSLRDASYFKTWLTRITMNCAFQQHRASFQPLAIEPSQTTSFEERLVDRLYLDDLLDVLEPTERSIIYFRYEEDLSLQEIAQTFNVPLSTIKSTLYRALEKVRRQKGMSL
ncbi:sigma-70 family RNA polymerase sigma factor [Exiguobacterium indicum]|uniref:sigma-70 family RNA polymerase sigma factor n=1 Tax=Exiguobacterium indicum TaxID=296995 RepID=UPI00094FDA6F|nr:sigma-70 family RNA polymerase sigma factor [Exiguobacterium indicum]